MKFKKHKQNKQTNKNNINKKKKQYLLSCSTFTSRLKKVTENTGKIVSIQSWKLMNST